MTAVTSYPYTIEEAEGGGYIVQFVDLPEATTEGGTLEEAKINADIVLNVALGGRISEGIDVPKPSETRDKNIYFVIPEADIQVALQVRWLREAEGITMADLARGLDTSFQCAQSFEEIPNDPTLNKLSALANVFGKQLVISFE